MERVPVNWSSECVISSNKRIMIAESIDNIRSEDQVDNDKEVLVHLSFIVLETFKVANVDNRLIVISSGTIPKNLNGASNVHYTIFFRESFSSKN